MDLLEVDQWEAQKSRFRKTTAKGVEIAVSLDRGTYMRDGDVLLWDAQAPAAIVARIDLRDVMVVHLDDLMRVAPEMAMRTCVELGHAMGNQHWPALVKDNARVCAAHRRPQGDGVGHEYASLRGNPLRVRTRPGSRSLPRSA